jgi:hypothetical protein
MGVLYLRILKELLGRLLKQMAQILDLRILMDLADFG